MVQDSGDFSKQGSNVLGAVRDLDVEKLLDSKGKTLLIGHHGNVIQSVEVGKSLEVGFVFDQLLSATVEQTDVRVGTDDLFATELEDESKHTVGGRMLRSEVDSVVSDLAILDRVLARLFGGARNNPGSAIGVAGVRKVIVNGDQPGAHGLGGGVFSEACRGERASGNMNV